MNQYRCFKKKLSSTVKAHKRQNKNAIQGIALNYTAHQYLEGEDLMQIEGVTHSTILSIMSEIGPAIKDSYTVNFIAKSTEKFYNKNFMLLCNNIYLYSKYIF